MVNCRSKERQLIDRNREQWNVKKVNYCSILSNKEEKFKSNHTTTKNLNDTKRHFLGRGYIKGYMESSKAASVWNRRNRVFFMIKYKYRKSVLNTSKILSYRYTTAFQDLKLKLSRANLSRKEKHQRICKGNQDGA